MGKGNEAGPFATAFAWIGGLAGAAGGYEAAGGGGMIVAAVILGVIGFFVGQVADAILRWVVFLLTCLIVLLVNAAVRRFLWELMSAMFE